VNLPVLFFEFCKIGLFSVGGGLATLPFLFELADKAPWLTHEGIGNFLAVANSSPGAIGVNLSALVGFEAGGVPGLCTAALGLILPAIITITIIARMFQAFKENRIVVSVFSGLRPAAAALLVSAGLSAWKLILYNPGFSPWFRILKWREFIIFAGFSLIIYKFKLHPIVCVISAAVLGVALGL
jgi:chromate transporter